MCQYIHEALGQLFILKIQENRGVEVNLGFASAYVPRKKITRSVLRFPKISAFNVTKIPPCPVPTFYELMLQDFLFSFLLP